MHNTKMKKILTITLHCTDNSGSSLQALALQTYLSGLGHQCEIINYCPSYLKYNGNFIKSIIINFTINLVTHIKTMHKLQEFRKRYLVTTRKKYKSIRSLSKEKFDCDVLISGSDQLWNPSYKCGNDEAYFLSFVKNTTIEKIAYAASVGKDNLSYDEIKKLNEKTKDFKVITVRENQISEHIFNKPTNWVCDPVFLLDKKYYINMLNSRPINGKYLLVYLIYENDPLLDEYILNYKKVYDGIVIQIGGFRKKCNCDKHIKELDPVDFLTYIYYSDYLISSSFHATAFSILFNKKFSVLLPKKNKSRILSLLSISKGLNDRIINSNNIEKNIDTNIDFSIVNNDFEHFIKKSKSIITNEILGD